MPFSSTTSAAASTLRRGGAGGRAQALGVLPYDQHVAEAQRTAMQFSSEAQTGADYAAYRVADAQTYAKRELAKLQQLQAAGYDIPEGRLKELNEIANPSFAAQALQKAAPVFKILEGLDRVRQVVTLGAKDALGFDAKHGAEISAGNYWDVLSGNKVKLIEELGVGVVGEDGMVGFSTVLDDLGWEKTDSTFNSVIRGLATFAGEVATDPFTWTGVGAMGMSKAARTGFLKAAVDEPKSLLRRALLHGDSELAERGSSFARGLVKKGDEAHAALKQSEFDLIEDAVRNGNEEVLERYGIASINDMLEAVPGFQRTVMQQSGQVERLIMDTVQSTSEQVARETVDKAVLEATDSYFNGAIKALMAKDFADPVLSEIAEGALTQSSTFLKGGLRFTVPLVTKRAQGAGRHAGKYSVAVPGTVGKGRLLSNVIFGKSSRYAKNADAKGARRVFENLWQGRAYEVIQKQIDRFSHDGVLNEIMGGAAHGKQAALIRAMNDIPGLAAGREVESGIAPLRQSVVDMSNAAKKSDLSDEDLHTLMTGLSRVFEMRRGAGSDELMKSLNEFVRDAGLSPDVLDADMLAASRAWFVAQHETLTYIGDQFKALDIIEDGLENYTPHVTTGELHELLESMLRNGIVIEGDTMGHHIVRQLLAAHKQSMVVGETVVGEAAATAQRRIGQTAVITDVGDVPLVTANTTLIRSKVEDITKVTSDLQPTALRGGLTSAELNDEILKVLEEAAETQPRLIIPKPKEGRSRFEAYNENPVDTMQIYSHDMLSALVERDMIDLLENAGLVADGVRVVNQHILASELAANLGRYGSDAVETVKLRTAAMTDEAKRLLQSVDDGVDVADDLVSVRMGGIDVQLSKSTLEANRKLARQVARLTGKEASNAAVVARQEAFFQDAYNALRKKGVSEARAKKVASAETRKELKGILREATRETKNHVRAQLGIARLNIATDPRVTRKAAEKVHRQAVAEANKKIDIVRKANRDADEFLKQVKNSAVPHHTPVSSVADMQAANDLIREEYVNDLKSLADGLDTLGEADTALLVRTMVDAWEAAGGRFADVNELMGNVESHVRNAFRKQRARASVAYGDERTVAWADSFLDQAEELDLGNLDVGNWGRERYADARWAFHTSDSPNPDRLYHGTRYGDAGLTANPTRAANADGEWVLVYDLDTLPTGVSGSLRSGYDIEHVQQFGQMVGDEAMPRPVAILPAGSVREGLRRREAVLEGAADLAADPDPRIVDARKHAISAWHDEFAPRAKGEHVPVYHEGPSKARFAGEGSDTYEELYLRVSRSSAADLAADPRGAQNVVEEYWGLKLTNSLVGELDEVMTELWAASQASLRARGLGSEFLAWPTGSEFGASRMSLDEVKGVSPVMVNRTDVILDWGAVGRGESRRNLLLVAPERLMHYDGARTIGFPPKNALHQLKPENLTFDRVLKYMNGDEELAREAYQDLLLRLDDVGSMPIDQLSNVADIRTTMNRVSGRRGNLAGLEAAERALSDPVNYGHMFEDADVQLWYRELNAPEDVDFVQIWMVERDGEWVRGTGGENNAILTTVPAGVDYTQVRRLSRKQIEAAAGELDMTITELKMNAEMLNRRNALSPGELREIDEDTALAFNAAEAIFEGRLDLHHSLSGMTDEITVMMDDAASLADEVAALKGGRRPPGEAAGLGRPRPEYTREDAVRAVTNAYDEFIRIGTDTTVGSAVRALDGSSATRGVAVGTGIGEIRLPENIRPAQLELWADMHSEALSRQGAHILIRQDGGETVMEIATVFDSAGRARSAGIEEGVNAIVNLADGTAISLPTRADKAAAAVKRAQGEEAAATVIRRVENALNGNHMDTALGILQDDKNAHMLRELIGQHKYSEMLDIVQSERILRLKIVPEANALKANAQTRRIMLNAETAAQAAMEVEAESALLKRAAITDTAREQAELGEEVGRLLREVVHGVGLDAETRSFRDPSLYPNLEDMTLVESSEFRLAQVKQIEAHARALGWDDIADGARQTVADFEVLIAKGRPASEQTLSVFGIGGRVTQFKTAESVTAQAIERSMARWQAIMHPEGLMQMGKELRWIARAWKSMATVARPNFHTRNFIGAAWNNSVIEVGVRDYAWVRNRGLKYRQMQRNGATVDEMKAFFGEADWQILEDARVHGVFGEGFAAGDYLKDATRDKLHRPTLRQAIDPGSKEAVQNQLGARAMTSIEDFHRLAAFKRWHSELGAEGARNMVNMVHFNYADLTLAETSIKKYVPFFVWTRNNIPLQVRLMVERPGMATRYTHLMNAVDDNFGDDGERWPLNSYQSPFAATLGLQMGSDQNWARLVFDPDVPLLDLATLDQPWKPESWFNFMANALGPHVTLPLSVSEQNEWGKTNAPMGWNTALKVADFVTPGFFNPSYSAQGDVQVGFGHRNTMNTMFPFLSEYGNMFGLGPNDPNQAQKLGLDYNDGVSASERLRSGVAFLGRGLGIQAQTPNDARTWAGNAESRARDIVDELKLGGYLKPEDLVSPQAVAALKAAGVDLTP
jgi:hypothetical protein